MASLADIARATGLAVTTVSEILREKPGYSDDTRQLVLEAAKRLDYRPNFAARQLRGAKSGLLGVLIGLENPRVNFDRLAYLERECFAQGYRLMVGQILGPGDKAAEYLRDLAARGIDGMFWLHQPFAGPKDTLIAPKAFDRIRHVVSLDSAVIPSAGVVRIDYAAGIRNAIRHLVSAGRRRIGIALAGVGPEGDPTSERLRGFRQSARESGAVAKDAVWVGDLSEVPSQSHIDLVIADLVRGHLCDAILASNDVWAAALLRGLRRAGLRVPDDVAVVGFDNLDFAELCDPALTTIDQRHDLFAAQAVGMMLASYAAPMQSEPVLIEPKLVTRESA